jgi:glyoxylase-like metal-dependent hydrolase (beta-lactamase superfamily II)
MELVSLTPSACQLRGGSNAGLVLHDGRAVLVDTGLDRDTAKRIIRILEGLRVALAAVVVTHAHADHFGGAATLRGRLGVPVYAPALEAAVIANPLLEPIYLHSGAAPMAELRGKFILAEPCPVDRLLESGETIIEGVPLKVIPAPGHAPNQMMIAGGDVCFVADAVFAPEVAAKHVIPFYVEVDQTLASLAMLAGLDGQYAAFAPGHGAAVPSIARWAAENAARLVEIRAAVQSALETSGDPAQILKRTADRLGLAITHPVTYCLTQTTILACLSSLQRAGAAAVRVVDNRLIWGPAG